MLYGPDRDWTDALEKVHSEGRCRNCNFTGSSTNRIVCAHTAGRRYDPHKICKACTGGRSKVGPRPCHVCKGRGHLKGRYVPPEAVIPLCEHCHDDQHAGKLELLPLLTVTEQIYCVGVFEGIENARTHLAPSAYRKAA
jgi:hypothetical protein